MRKRILFFIMTILTCLTLVSCKKKKTTEVSTKNNQTTASTKSSHTHKFDKQVIESDYLKSPASCTSKAIYYYSCSCGEKGEETFEYGSPTGHSWDNNNWHYDAENHYHVCERCGEHKDITTHSLDEVIDKEATYTEKGEHHYVCKHCDYVSEKTEIDMKEQITPEYTVPTDITAKYGDTLADIDLPAGFSFQDELTTPVGSVGENIFKVTYKVVDDTISKYKTITDIDLSIIVEKGIQQIIIAQDFEVEYGNPIITDDTFTHIGNGSITISYRLKADPVYTSVAPTECGEYYARIIADETSNYLGAEVIVGFSIVKANQVITIENLSKSYDTNPVDPTDKFSYLGTGEVNIEYKKAGEADSTYTTTAPKNSGDYVIRISVGASTNYNAGFETADFSINKVTPTINSLPTQGSTNYVGQTLGSIILTGGSASVDGSFNVVNAEGYIINTYQTISLIFIPTDDNYNSIENLELAITARYFEIIVTVGEGGYSSQSGTNYIEYGENFTITFTFSNNYSVKTLTVDGENVTPRANYTFNNVTSNHTISATFDYHESKYDFTVVNAGNGTVWVEDDSDTFNDDNFIGTQSFDYDEIIYLSFIPNTGYYIESIKCNGSALSISDVDRVEYFDYNIRLNSNYTFEVVFKANPVISFNIGEHGKANTKQDGTGTTLTGDVSYDYASRVTLYIIADENYYIVSSDDSETGKTIITKYFSSIVEDIALTYEFVLKPKISYEITGNGSIKNGNESSSATIGETEYVNYNNDRVVYIFPDANNYISSITVNGEELPLTYDDQVEDYYRLQLRNVTDDIEVSVEFKENPTITVKYDINYTTVYVNEESIKNNTPTPFKYGLYITISSDFIADTKEFSKLIVNGVEITGESNIGSSYIFYDVTNFNSNIVVEVEVSGKKMEFSLPTTQIGYTLTSDKETYEFGDEVTLTFELDNSYQPGYIYLGSTVLISPTYSAFVDGKYTFTINRNIEVTDREFNLKRAYFRVVIDGSTSYGNDYVEVEYISEIAGPDTGYIYGDNFTIKFRLTELGKKLLEFDDDVEYDRYCYLYVYDGNGTKETFTLVDGWYQRSFKASDYDFPSNYNLYIHTRKYVQEVSYVSTGTTGNNYLYIQDVDKHTATVHGIMTANVYTTESIELDIRFEDTYFISEVRVNGELFTGTIDIDNGQIVLYIPIYKTEDGKTVIEASFTTEALYQISVVNTRNDIEVDIDITKPFVDGTEETTITVTPKVSDLIVTLVCGDEIIESNTITYTPTSSQQWSIFFREPESHLTYIRNAQDLQNISDNFDGYYVLKNDIDMIDFDFTPIREFTGTLLGNGHKISNLNIITNDYACLFEVVSAAEISGITFENLSLEATDSEAITSLFYRVFGSEISNITFTGTLSVKAYFASLFANYIICCSIKNIMIEYSEDSDGNIEQVIRGNYIAAFADMVEKSTLDYIQTIYEIYTIDSMSVLISGFVRLIQYSTFSRISASCYIHADVKKADVVPFPMYRNYRIVGFADICENSEISLCNTYIRVREVNVENVFNYVGFISIVRNSTIANCYSDNNSNIYGEFGNVEESMPHESYITAFVLVCEDDSIIEYTYSYGDIRIYFKGDPDIAYSDIYVYDHTGIAKEGASIRNSFAYVLYTIELAEDAEEGTYNRDVHFYRGIDCDEDAEVNNYKYYINNCTSSNINTVANVVKDGTALSYDEIIDEWSEYDEELEEDIYYFAIKNVCSFDENIWIFGDEEPILAFWFDEYEG